MSFFSQDDAATRIAKMLDLDPKIVSVMIRYGGVKIQDGHAVFEDGQYGRPFDSMGNASWSRAAVLMNLRSYREHYHSYNPKNPMAELDVAIDGVPDDTACAAIGWFARGFRLSEGVNGMIFSNAPNEGTITNLLGAVDASRLSQRTVDVLADEIEAMELYDGILPDLQVRIDASRAQEEADRLKRREPSETIEELEE